MAAIDEQDTTRATNDAYTGMLAISLLALIAGCALLYLDWSQYPSNPPPKAVAPVPQMAPAAPEQPAQPKGPPMPMPMPMQP